MKFKNLESDDILISPFQVHKTFTVNNNDSGSGVYSIPLTKGSDSNLYDWSISSPSVSPSGNQFFKIRIVDFIIHIFY